jgi:hypothetical protein
MIRRKVYVLVENGEIKCYHNLKQLTETNKLPYFTIARALRGYKTYQSNNILIGHDTIEYKTKRYKPSQD